MSVVIKTIATGEKYEVNGKLVYKDGNENFVATEELTTQETNEFRRHIKAENR